MVNEKLHQRLATVDHLYSMLSWNNIFFQQLQFLQQPINNLYYINYIDY